MSAGLKAIKEALDCASANGTLDVLQQHLDPDAIGDFIRAVNTALGGVYRHPTARQNFIIDEDCWCDDGQGPRMDYESGRIAELEG